MEKLQHRAGRGVRLGPRRAKAQSPRRAQAQGPDVRGASAPGDSLPSGSTVGEPSAVGSLIRDAAVSQHRVEAMRRECVRAERRRAAALEERASLCAETASLLWNLQNGGSAPSTFFNGEEQAFSQDDDSHVPEVPGKSGSDSPPGVLDADKHFEEGPFRENFVIYNPKACQAQQVDTIAPVTVLTVHEEEQVLHRWGIHQGDAQDAEDQDSLAEVQGIHAIGPVAQIISEFERRLQNSQRSLQVAEKSPVRLSEEQVSEPTGLRMDGDEAVPQHEASEKLLVQPSEEQALELLGMLATSDNAEVIHQEVQEELLAKEEELVFEPMSRLVADQQEVQAKLPPLPQFQDAEPISSLLAGDHAVVREEVFRAKKSSPYTEFRLHWGHLDGEASGPHWLSCMEPDVAVFEGLSTEESTTATGSEHGSYCCLNHAGSGVLITQSSAQSSALGGDVNSILGRQFPAPRIRPPPSAVFGEKGFQERSGTSPPTPKDWGFRHSPWGPELSSSSSSVAVPALSSAAGLSSLVSVTPPFSHVPLLSNDTGTPRSRTGSRTASRAASEIRTISPRSLSQLSSNGHEGRQHRIPMAPFRDAELLPLEAVGPSVRVGGGHTRIDEVWQARNGHVYARGVDGVFYELRRGRLGEPLIGKRTSLGYKDNS